MSVLPSLLNASACASGVVRVQRGDKGLPPVLLAHPGVGARALLHLLRLHTNDAKDVLKDAFAEDGLKLRRLVVGPRLRQRRGRAAHEHVRYVRLLAGLAGAANGNLRASEMCVALLEALAPTLDGLARLLFEIAVEGVDVGARVREPLAHRRDEAVDGGVDVQRVVMRVLDRQHELIALNAAARPVEVERTRPELEDISLALERHVDDDAVAGYYSRGFTAGVRLCLMSSCLRPVRGYVE